MGGLLIADAALDIWHNTRAGDPMWPRVIAIMAFDTPYLGLHPHVFKHGLSQAATYYEQAKNVASAVGMFSPVALGLGFGKFGGGGGSSKDQELSQAGPSRLKSTDTADSKPPPSKSWFAPTKTLYGLGAIALGAAAVGTAYYRREDFASGWKYGYDHMTFVGNLWDAEALSARLEALDRIGRERGVQFWK
jgi:hypothetical protein